MSDLFHKPPPEQAPYPWVQRFQLWLDRANHRAGGLGALLTTVTLALMLFYALVVILEEYFLF